MTLRDIWIQSNYIKMNNEFLLCNDRRIKALLETSGSITPMKLNSLVSFMRRLQGG